MTTAESIGFTSKVAIHNDHYNHAASTIAPRLFASIFVSVVSCAWWTHECAITSLRNTLLHLHEDRCCRCEPGG